MHRSTRWKDRSVHRPPGGGSSRCWRDSREFVLIGQALSRQSIVEREMYPTLSALGLRPNQLFGIGMVRVAAIGVAGMAGALAFAVAVSPLTPVGEARAAEPTEGFLFDTLVFGLGAVAIVTVVLLLAAHPSWRASRVRTTVRDEDRPARHGPSRIVSALAQAGAPPSILIGTRHALERGRGRSSVPVAAALVGAVVAVAALVATTVFGASLSNLLATPRLYGLGWQVDLGNLTYQQATGVVKEFALNPSVTKITYGINGKYVDVNGSPVEATAVKAGKGPLVFSLIDGRYPHGDGEIALGTQTLSAAACPCRLSGLAFGHRAVGYLATERVHSRRNDGVSAEPQSGRPGSRSRASAPRVS